MAHAGEQAFLGKGHSAALEEESKQRKRTARLFVQPQQSKPVSRHPVLGKTNKKEKQRKTATSLGV